MAEPNNNPELQEPTPGAGGELTFTQAELDALVSKEKARAVAKATKGIPTEEEITAYRAWKESQQTEQERMTALISERDAAKTALSEIQNKMEQMERETLLRSKGVPESDLDYYLFKIGKLVTDTKPFDKAAEEFLKDNAPNNVRVDMTARLDSGKTPAGTANDAMNRLIRNAFR